MSVIVIIDLKDPCFSNQFIWNHCYLYQRIWNGVLLLINIRSSTKAEGKNNTSDALRESNKIIKQILLVSN